MKRCSWLLPALFLCIPGFGQRTVLTYPFILEKGFLQRPGYDAEFLDNQATNNFAFILKDNKKADYVLINDKFKVGAEFPADLDQTVFTHDFHNYLGGTTDKNIYHYIYKVTDKKFLSANTITYMEETVDFDSKTLSAKKIFDIPTEEQLLVSFCDHNHYFTITANKKTSDLHFYQVLANGDATMKTVHFDIPAGMSKNKNELTEYLGQLKVVKDNEEPGLDVAVHSAKLFCYADRLVFAVNDGDKPTHLFTVDLNTFNGTSGFIDHSSLVEKENRGKSYVSSFLKDNKVFTLILNKKDIKVAVYNADGSLINKVVIDGDNGMDMLADPPVTETRMGKTLKGEDVDDIKKVIRAFTKGTEGLTVGTNKNGQFVVQVGTYDLVPVPSGGTVGGHWTQVPTWDPNNAMMNNTLGAQNNWHDVWVPGYSSYMTTSARYYKTTYFRVLLDPKTFKAVHGRVPETIGDQVKNYIDDSDNKRVTAAKQFAIADKQYYGFYDRDRLAYVIEEINIRK